MIPELPCEIWNMIEENVHVMRIQRVWRRFMEKEYALLDIILELECIDVNTMLVCDGNLAIINYTFPKCSTRCRATMETWEYILLYVRRGLCWYGRNFKTNSKVFKSTLRMFDDLAHEFNMRRGKRLSRILEKN